MKIRLSVCITTYNRSEGLARTLASLARQTRVPDEVIVSDDCSSDGTSEVVAEWAQRLPSVRYMRNGVNLRMPGNLNSAIRAASGDYIANLHDADELAPTLLEKWENALDNFPSAGFVFCGIGGWPHRTSHGNGIILHPVAPLTSGRAFFESFLKHKFSSIVWGTVMARRTAYDRLLPFDERFGFTSDVDMWMRMCLNFDVAYVREPLIVLDHSPTQERARGVNWQWVDTARRMQLVNLARFYGAEPAKLARENSRHRRLVMAYLLRRLLGRVWHRDRKGFLQGLSLVPAAIRMQTGFEGSASA